jgi:hypothetical protein
VAVGDGPLGSPWVPWSPWAPGASGGPGSGLYALRLSEGVGELVPVNGTFVWTAFCALLPDEATLAGWLSGPADVSDPATP